MTVAIAADVTRGQSTLDGMRVRVPGWDRRPTHRCQQTLLPSVVFRQRRKMIPSFTIPHAYTQSRSPSASTTSVGAKIGAGFWRSRYSIKELLVEGELYWLFGSLTFAEPPKRVQVAENEPIDALAHVGFRSLPLDTARITARTKFSFDILSVRSND